MKLLTLGIIFIIILILCLKGSSEPYTNYMQMTRLPWCNKPLSSLPACKDLKSYYPGQNFPIGYFPINYPPDRSVIYQTGDSEGPNTEALPVRLFGRRL